MPGLNPGQLCDRAVPLLAQVNGARAGGTHPVMGGTQSQGLNHILPLQLDMTPEFSFGPSQGSW